MSIILTRRLNTCQLSFQRRRESMNTLDAGSSLPAAGRSGMTEVVYLISGLINKDGLKMRCQDVKLFIVEP